MKPLARKRQPLGIHLRSQTRPHQKAKKANQMKKPTIKKNAATKLTLADEEMSTYGISRVPMDDQFQFGDYRYTSLEHAVAEAKREKLRSS